MNPLTDFNWSEEAVNLLKRLWDEGLTATEMTEHFRGVSRSAILGKIHRLDLPKRREHNPVQKRIPKPKTLRTRMLVMANGIERMELPPEPLPPSNPIAFMDLEPHHCRWPVSDAPPMFCGRNKVDGFSYCLGHCDMAYRNARPISRAESEIHRRVAIKNYRKRAVA